MTPRLRVLLVVALAATVAAAATIGVTLLQTRGETTTASGTGAVGKPRKGVPPLMLDLGVRGDPEAVQLRRALVLYQRGRRPAAARIFSRYDSLEARIGAAFADWPGRSLDTLKQLVAAHPRSSVAQLHLGLAYFWSGRNADAAASWRRALRLQPDTPYAVSAESLLFSRMAPGRPPFVPDFQAPARLARLAPARQLAALASRARSGGARARILYGVALQQLGRPLSAERQFAAAARLAPRDPDARVAAAVGRFTKQHPERAFSRLGPLSQTFPKAAVVRFHLGLLLLWMRQLDQARKELRLARSDAPGSVYAREAKTFLDSLGSSGTK